MLYKVTVKSNQFTNGVRLEKGMTAEVAFQSSNLLGNAQGCELVQKAFMAKYGVDLKKACAINSLRLDVQKIN